MGWFWPIGGLAKHTPTGENLTRFSKDLIGFSGSLLDCHRIWWLLQLGQVAQVLEEKTPQLTRQSDWTGQRMDWVQ